MSSVSWKPAEQPTMITSLLVEGAKDAIAWYVSELGGVVHDQMMDESGQRVLHSGVRFGDSALFVSDPSEAMNYPSNAASTRLYLYVPDVDAVFKRVTAKGAKVVNAPKDEFWGDRSARIVDPFGVHWALNTHIKDVSPDEMQKAAKDWASKNKEECQNSKAKDEH